MLAPEPFFEPRGTPFSEYHRIKALSELGYRIDLVTYPLGADVAIPNLEIHRCARLPFVRRVPVGPSIVKVFLDLLLTMTATRLAFSRHYAAVHSHEEAGVLGVWLASWLGVPHLYDMHSSLPQQLRNFRYTRLAIAQWLFEWVERTMVERSRVVVTICPELQDTAIALGAGDRARLIENVMGGDVDQAEQTPRDALRARYGLDPDQPVLLYTGTFEPVPGPGPPDRRCNAPPRHASGRARPRRGRHAGPGGHRPRPGRAGGQPPRLHGAASPGGDRQLRRRLRHPGLTTDQRHEHTTENLFVPPVGTTDRGDRSAHAHPGPHAGHRSARAARAGRRLRTEWQR